MTERLPWWKRWFVEPFIHRVDESEEELKREIEEREARLRADVARIQGMSEARRKHGGQQHA